MATLAELLSTLCPAGPAWTVQISEDWKQGRTLYGGFSSALCVETASRAFTGLPRLRSAQFAFIGPAAGELHITCDILRQGKSTVFASVDLVGEAGLATRALLCFGAPRPTAIDVSDCPAPAVQPPEQCPPFILAGGTRPAFLDHFDVTYAAPAGEEFLLWARLRESAGIRSDVAATLIADLPPPAVMARFGGGAPASTMTWHVDYAETEAPGHNPADGWRLIRSRTQTAASGYSSQAIDVWTRSGQTVITSRQSVAVFA